MTEPHQRCAGRLLFFEVEMTNNVVDLKKTDRQSGEDAEVSREPQIIEFKIREKERCTHSKKIYIDRQSRCLECDTCGKVIDPFDYLDEWAKLQRNANFGLESARKKTEELLKRKAEDLREGTGSDRIRI